MTNFSYKNAQALETIGEKCFGENGSIEHANANDIVFLQYIMAYRVCWNKTINPVCYKKVREAAREYEIPIEVFIFFDKIEKCSDDLLYFIGVLKKQEETPMFLEEYEKYLEMVA
jgi:hypothetical protein